MKINAASHLAAVNRTVLFVNSDELLRALLALTEERGVRSFTLATFAGKSIPAATSATRKKTIPWSSAAWLERTAPVCHAARRMLESMVSDSKHPWTLRRGGAPRVYPRRIELVMTRTRTMSTVTAWITIADMFLCPSVIVELSLF